MLRLRLLNSDAEMATTRETIYRVCQEDVLVGDSIKSLSRQSGAFAVGEPRNEVDNSINQALRGKFAEISLRNTLQSAHILSNLFILPS